MKPFSAEKISEILNGNIIKGPPNLIVNEAVYYVEQLNKPHTLIFLRFTSNINWEAIKKFAPVVIVSDKKFEAFNTLENCTIILVDNILLAFWSFVYYYRKLFDIPVIAVTGTCGKSTTKEMIIHMLKRNFNVVGTNVSANSRTHNLNYLLTIDESTEAAVFETPVGKPGDITNSCKYFKPSIGVLTNISLDHMEGCKTMENYIKAKSEILTAIGNKGVLIINNDDENIKRIDFQNFKGRIVSFGIKNTSEFQASNIEYAEGGMLFTLDLCSTKYNIFVPGYGVHQIYNALAAFSAIHELGMKIEEGNEALRSFRNLPCHIEVEEGINGSIVIDDTWNINLSSAKAAIEVLDGISKGRKRIAVIGDMNAYGDMALDAHIEVGDIIAKSNAIDSLITIGSLTAKAGIHAAKLGYKGEHYIFSNVEGIYELLLNMLDSNSIILIKSAGYHDRTILNLVKKLLK